MRTFRGTGTERGQKVFLSPDLGGQKGQEPYKGPVPVPVPVPLSIIVPTALGPRTPWPSLPKPVWQADRPRKACPSLWRKFRDGQAFFVF